MGKKLALIYGAAIIVDGAIIVGGVCKKAYETYKRQRFQLRVAEQVINVQHDIIEDLLKEKKTESK